jgi:F-box interacting protein
LICLIGEDLVTSTAECEEVEYWFRLWNPSTRAIFEKTGCFIDNSGFGFNFVCDNSTGNFKLVPLRHIPDDQLTSDVRVFSFKENVWKNIQGFPVIPFDLSRYENFEYDAVFFNGTLNWLAIRKDVPYIHYHKPEGFTVEQFVIISLDLGIETYNMYRLPQGFDEVPPAKPTVGVLEDCFCFSYCYKETDFIIWQMKKFGIEESWTRFLKISYQDLPLDSEFNSKYLLYFVPLFLSKDGDTLILYGRDEMQLIIYNWRDHRVERTEVNVHKTIIDDGSIDAGRIETDDWSFWHLANSFVESLTPIC